ncbi:hypothetical protein GH714_034748 [Hevea brasiliensis]|uniref:AB hydrolase-1 domain-containing protein n=1 Tax=Hevea brasiliensis TaxID=3981 RepID=A0A6A6KVE1_HEVBR|nr:hypothetical protein GH714_034748 [Hevea brasiliensis]
MAKCFSFSASRDSCYRYFFTKAGLKSSTTDLGDGTVMHCWVPKTHFPAKPSLLLIHGFGANAMWQFNDFIPPLKSKFNLYVPDLLFFGDSYTNRPERTEAFQAQCIMALMDALNVKNMDLMGLSYGGFVAYSMAAQFKERVGRVVLGCAGVCLEEKDMEEGMFKVKTVDEAISILLPQSPRKGGTVKFPFGMYEFQLQNSLLNQGHIGENAELVIIKNVGHALNAERPKELYKHMKSFLIDTLPPSKQGKYTMVTKQIEMSASRERSF